MSTRTSKAKKNIILMFLIKGISIFISFLYVPLLLHGLNSENYGIWLTLTSIIAWVSVFDIGLGNGLRNKLAISLAQHDYEKGRIYVSTAYVCIFILILSLIVFFLLIYQYVPWNKVLNADSVDFWELRYLVLIVFITFCFQFSLGLLNSVLYAFQMPALSSFILMMGQLVAYIVVFVLVKIFSVSSILILGGIVSCVPSVVLFISSVFLYSGQLKCVAPSWKYYRKEFIKEILSLGIKFFVLQIITVVLFQTNNFIIAHIIDNQSVVRYNVSFKYMQSLVMIFTIVAMPMWSATTDAYTKGSLEWIKSANKGMLKIIMLLSLCGLFMLVFSPYVYKIWLGDSDIEIDILTTFLLYLYSVATMIYGCYGYMLNGIGKLELQVRITSILAIAYIPFSIFAGHLGGLNGVLFVFFMTSLINAIWSKMQFTKIISGTASGIWNK